MCCGRYKRPSRSRRPWARRSRGCAIGRRTARGPRREPARSSRAFCRRGSAETLMTGRLTRFLNLERSRKPASEAPTGVANVGRFGGEPPRAAEPVDAFKEERQAQIRSGIDVEMHGAEEQPFLRCPVCEADNSRYAVKCLNCQRSLDGPEVLAWNRQLWAARRAQ